MGTKLGARIILQPSFGISLEQMKGKLKGKIRISKRSVLILDGDVTIDGLELDGALQVSGNGVLKDKVVKNAGQPIMAIAESELSGKPASLQIRGYEMADGEILCCS